MGKINVLIIGSGGREHSLAWAIAKSPMLEQLYCSPGNAGMAQMSTCMMLDVDNHQAIIDFVVDKNIGFVVIGPEAPLVDGLSDSLKSAGIKAFGPSGAAAQLEGSKAFTKDLCAAHNIPTAAYGRFKEATAAKAYLQTQKMPIVIKADGLAAGKGVVICDTLEEAENEVEAMMTGKFGEASAEIVIEEFMSGEEASIFVLTDGEGAIYLPPAQDHKQVGDGDTGPNTGGMGAYAPAPVMTPQVMELVQALVVEPLLSGMAEDGMPYQGVLYVGIMVTEDGPKVVEFNARFGDPECQVLMAGLPGDIVPALLVCATGGLVHAHREISEMMGLREFVPSATVVLATEGYPGDYAKGSIISGVEAADALEGVTVFHAGTDRDSDGKLIAAGGRVLGVTATGDDLKQALDRAYAGVDALDWPQGFCRRDIGWRALK
ncbi:MAG: phosphoribosylamine--glycine ligase [Henriciella sp.]|nr:phosphoribosylamine--glycine ligase [Henriciella sp.]